MKPTALHGQDHTLHEVDFMIFNCGELASMRCVTACCCRHVFVGDVCDLETLMNLEFSTSVTCQKRRRRQLRPRHVCSLCLLSVHARAISVRFG